MFDKQRAGKRTITQFTCVETESKQHKQFFIAGEAEKLISAAWNLSANTDDKTYNNPLVSFSMWKEFGEETFNTVADNEKEKLQNKARQFFFKLATTPPDISPSLTMKLVF